MASMYLDRLNDQTEEPEIPGDSRPHPDPISFPDEIPEPETEPAINPENQLESENTIRISTILPVCFATFELYQKVLPVSGERYGRDTVRSAEGQPNCAHQLSFQTTYSPATPRPPPEPPPKLPVQYARTVRNF